MLRSEVNQGILELFKDPTYLEIGVAHGETFHAIQAAQKVAVDPRFAFDLNAAKAEAANANCEYNEVLSDIYFSEHQSLGRKFDVIFIDGLHTFDQTLKDLMNSVVSLNDGGVIIVDDVIPANYAASISDTDTFLRFQAALNGDATWMGDVFRLVFFVQQYMPLFEYATVQENHGQMVMWRGRRPYPGHYVTKVETISRLDYSDVILKADAFKITPYANIIESIRQTMI